MNGSATDLDDEREQRLERAERQMREYSQNIENGRGDRNGRAKQSVNCIPFFSLLLIMTVIILRPRVS